MKTAILLTLFLLQAVGLSSKILQPSADADALNDTLFVYLNDGGMDAYPSSLASISRLPDGAVEAVWKDGTIIMIIFWTAIPMSAGGKPWLTEKSSASALGNMS